jgi:hypothetical protein
VPLPPHEQDRLPSLFFPHIDNKKREVMDSGCRFVYYTTADTATKILESKQIWLRNTAVMNDYSEVQYGFQCLYDAYKTEPGNNFNTALNTCWLMKLGNISMAGCPLFSKTLTSHAYLSTYPKRINMDASPCGEHMVVVPVSHWLSMVPSCSVTRRS